MTGVSRRSKHGAMLLVAAAIGVMMPALTVAQSLPPEALPQRDPTAPPPHNPKAGGVMQPPDVDPAMDQKVPNVDPNITKPPEEQINPKAPMPPDTRQNVQPR